MNFFILYGLKDTNLWIFVFNCLNMITNTRFRLYYIRKDFHGVLRVKKFSMTWETIGIETLSTNYPLFIMVTKFCRRASAKSSKTEGCLDEHRNSQSRRQEPPPRAALWTVVHQDPRQVSPSGQGGGGRANAPASSSNDEVAERANTPASSPVHGLPTFTLLA
jgi:hypothetical protein